MRANELLIQKCLINLVKESFYSESNVETSQLIIKTTNDIYNLIDSKEKQLNDFFLSKVEIANELELSEFCFMFEDKIYFSEWRKNKWSDPKVVNKL